MNSVQLHEEFKEANLSYMLLAKQMIQEDKAASLFRLGISEEMAELIAGLSTGTAAQDGIVQHVAMPFPLR